MLELIVSHLNEDWKHFESFFKLQTKNDHRILKFVARYCHRNAGKQIRPLFVLLSAKLHGVISKETFVGASLVQLVHSASLLHDDVVDNANLRRGVFSINALWGAKESVLVGDYFLAKGLSIAFLHNSANLLKETSLAFNEMSQGELLQIKKSRQLDYRMDNYFQIIEKKTASLFSCCGAVGALSVGASDKQVECMRNVGKDIGMAFQIKDDILDFLGTKKFGKTRGKDIMEQKITLPLILALQSTSPSERKKILRAVIESEQSPKALQKVIDFAHSNDGIKNATEILSQFVEHAKQNILEYPKSETKNVFQSLLDFCLIRDV